MLGKVRAALVGCGVFVVAALYILLFSVGNSTVYAEPAAGEQAGMEQTQKLERDFQTLSSGERLEPDRTYDSPGQPTVYLTFDDGPSTLTEQVLDILKQEGVQATFFVIGNKAQGEDKLLKRTVEEGHAVGNHSFDHLYKNLYGSFEVFWEEVQKTDAIIEKATGRKPSLIRAPGGTFTNFDPFYFYYLDEAGYSAIDWNMDSGDAARRGVPADEIVRNVKQSPLPHEAVLLMHDGIGHEETVKALPEIIRYFKEKGYAFAPIGSRTKPVQFHSANSKWNRVYSYESFVEDTERARTLKRERSGGEDSGRQAGLLQNGPSEGWLPLSVLGAVPWVLNEGEYDYGYGRFSVPLRSFAERLGGKISWDEATRTAFVRIGSQSVQYDPIHKWVRIDKPGMMPKVTYLADLRLIDGKIRVPLGGTAELFGESVSRYFVAGNKFYIEWQSSFS